MQAGVELASEGTGKGAARFESMCYVCATASQIGIAEAWAVRDIVVWC